MRGEEEGQKRMDYGTTVLEDCGMQNLHCWLLLLYEL